jgi:hypothetical protein
MMAFAAVAMQANGVQSNYLETMVTFDSTDSVPIGVDKRCMGCISNRTEDFEGPMIESNRAIKGFGGSRTTGIMIGTLAWRWMDNKTGTQVPHSKILLCQGGKCTATESTTLGPDTKRQ